MKFNEVAQKFFEIEASPKGLIKTRIVATVLEKIKKEPEVIYLFLGKVFPDFSEKETGFSEKLMLRAVAKAYLRPQERVVSEFKKFGDIGKVAEKFSKTPKSQISVAYVMKTLRELCDISGEKSVEKKIDIVCGVLRKIGGREAKYFTRLVLGDLKIGVGVGLLRDAIVEYCFKPKSAMEKSLKLSEVQGAYDTCADMAEVFNLALKDRLEEIALAPGRPLKAMLFVKAKNLGDAFRIVGSPCAFEYKYDGFRVMINKTKAGKISIFTRRLDEVTAQFPDIVAAVKNVKARDFILDAEAVGVDPKTGKHTAFEKISQRIKRKYDVSRLVDKLPVIVNVFDILYLNGKNLTKEPFKKRRGFLEKIVSEDKRKIVLANQIVTDDEAKAEKFMEEALSDGQEGLMGKSLSAVYKPGARVGFGVKIKPDARELDLVITGATWGRGKRAGFLTSFFVACRGGKNEFLEVGKVSTGLKEKRSEGLSFAEMTELLRGDVIEEKGQDVFVKPKIVISVLYQNIQKSPKYSSGFALRFPRVKALRVDKSVKDIASLDEIKREM